jgi:hypothetical protein
VLSILAIGWMLGVSIAPPANARPLVVDALSGEDVVIAATWDGLSRELRLELRPASFYDIDLTPSGMWTVGCVPAGVLVHQVEMTAAIEGTASDRTVVRTSGPMGGGVSTVVRGVRSRRSVDAAIPLKSPALVIRFPRLSQPAAERADGIDLVDVRDIDCDGVASPDERDAVSLLNAGVDAAEIAKVVTGIDVAVLRSLSWMSRDSDGNAPCIDE